MSAIDPASGEELWTYDPKAYELHTPTHGGFTQRGIEYWRDGLMEQVVRQAQIELLTAIIGERRSASILVYDESES